VRAAVRRIAESLKMARAAKSWAADLFEIVPNSAVAGLVASPGAVLALLHHGAAPAGGRGPGRQKVGALIQFFAAGGGERPGRAETLLAVFPREEEY
jgi:hypothetical protein